MSNMSQLFDASRFPDDVKVRANAFGVPICFC